MALARQRIHYSRVIRLDGVELPYWQKISENLWGQSVVERLFDRLIAFDSTTAGAAQLVYKAHLRTLAVDGLREVIGMGGPALEALIKNVDMIRRFQSNEGVTLIDAKDKFEAHQYSFSGLDNVLLQFGQQLSGATGIPLVRLFGQSPAGLNSTGESDVRNYYDNIKQQQERRLRLPLTRLLEVIVRSELGIEPPEGFQFGFNPLWQLSDTEKADIAQKTTQTVTGAYDDGLISQQTALKELRQSSHITGVWSNITDEMINEADDELPDLTEMNPDDPNAGQETQPEPKQPAADA
jgi:phage-related protein (TIGR01555 family)